MSIALHLGTLLSVLVYYRQEIARLLGSDRRVLLLLIVGTIPAAIVGVGIKKGLSDSMSDVVLNNVLLSGLMFFVTAAILVWAARRPDRRVDLSSRLSWRASAGNRGGSGVRDLCPASPVVARPSPRASAWVSIVNKLRHSRSS